MMKVTTVCRRFITVKHAVVPYYACNAQVIVLEYTGAAFRLRFPVQFQVPPLPDSGFIPPEGQ